VVCHEKGELTWTDNKVKVKENKVRTVPIAKISAKDRATIPAEIRKFLAWISAPRIASSTVKSINFKSETGFRYNKPGNKIVSRFF